MRTLNNFFLFGECATPKNCNITPTLEANKLQATYRYHYSQTESRSRFLKTRVNDSESTLAASPLVGEDTTTREMSRRKQFKPRHLDSDEGEISGDTTCETSAGDGDNGSSVQNFSELDQVQGLKGLTQDSSDATENPSSIVVKDMDKIHSSLSPVKSFDSDMPTLHRQDIPLQNGQNYFGSPNHRMTKPNNNKSPNPSDAKRAVVSPLPRTPPRHDINPDHHHMMTQPVAPSITPAEMERQYFQNIAAAARASAAAAAAAAAAASSEEQMRKDEYSDEDDVPSDIESCANESELQEELEKSNGHESMSSTGKIAGDQDQAKNREKHGSEKIIDAEEEADDGEYVDGSSTGAVKLKALETTNVAVAQVVENNNNEVREQLPNLQQVLFTLHQQQMFQLQVLQQIQQQVTKIAHHDGDMNGLKDEATAALYSMMGRGLPQSIQSSASDGSCDADDISEGSIGSPEEHMEDPNEGNEQPHMASPPFEGHKSRDPIHEYITPTGSPEPDHSGSNLDTSLSMDEDMRRPTFPEEHDEGFKEMPPMSKQMPPIPYLGGLGGHMMPGNMNPLLPSNMFGMPSPMSGGPGGFGPGRIPMFRSPVMPRQDEDETLEEFMEIDTSDTTKLEEFMKKVEPTLKDPNQCAVCKKVLSCKSALQMHYRTHTGSRPFKCKICSRAFTTKGNLKTHMSVHRSRPTGPSLHQCPVCSKKFNSVLHLQDHMRMHIGEIHNQPMPKHPMMPMLPQGFMPFMNYPLVPPTLPQDRKPDTNMSLPKDAKDFNVSFERKSPISSVEPVKRPPVDSVEELRQKRQRTDIIEPPKMENDRPYLTPEKNYKSDNEHSSPDTLNPYSASLLALEESVKEMDKKMAQSSNFFIKTEDSKLFLGPDKSSENPQSKEASPNGNNSHDDLQSRLESVQTSVITQVPTSQHKAPVSGPVISLPPSQSISHSHSPPSCPTSPFSSGRRQSLRHVCSVCHKPFSSSSALQIHMRTHTGERPFKCNVCDKAFTTKGNLKVHMGTHAIVTGPPRRGRRMSMENMPPFGSPGQFPPVMPRPPLGMFPSFPYSNMFLPGKGLPPFAPPVGFMPGSPMGMSMFGPRKDVDEKESSLSPPNVMDLHKASDSIDNNNGPSKGIHGELDLSIRPPTQQAIKT